MPQSADVTVLQIGAYHYFVTVFPEKVVVIQMHKTGSISGYFSMDNSGAVQATGYPLTGLLEHL